MLNQKTASSLGGVNRKITHNLHFYCKIRGEISCEPPSKKVVPCEKITLRLNYIIYEEISCELPALIPVSPPAKNGFHVRAANSGS